MSSGTILDALRSADRPKSHGNQAALRHVFFTAATPRERLLTEILEIPRVDDRSAPLPAHPPAGGLDRHRTRVADQKDEVAGAMPRYVYGGAYREIMLKYEEALWC